MLDEPLFSQLNVDDLVFDEVESLRAPIIDRFYKSQNAKVKCGRGERIFAVSHALLGEIAAVRMVRFPCGNYWLRNMMVDRRCRGMGVGRVLMQGVEAALAGTDIYCFSLIEVTGFYERLGFGYPKEKTASPFIWEHFTRYKTRGRDWVLMKRSA